jgi:selenide,water dikinase
MLLKGLPQTEDANLLVGYQTSDDAAVYRLTDDLAIVATADFITPPVNDPFIFGQVAAANALSDVYAMGGQPKVCLNLVCFPSKKLPPQDLHGIVSGALSKITESGAVLAGGHSVEDDEPKFGLSVVGVVHPERIWTNKGARPGDVLVLTKPIGSGVLFNANLKHWVSPNALQTCITALTTLNKNAALALQVLDLHAVTDVTGFGLAGHALEMAKGAGVTREIQVEALPVYDEALTMYRKGMSTGSNDFNRQMTTGVSHFEKTWPTWHEQILYDPQTSGGLLAALPAHQADEAIRALKAAATPAAAIIGRVLPKQGNTHLRFV